jgi:MFS superfamily sulfate permease-like transporter
VYDLAAGAAVSAMIVPHSLAMAILAGLPPVYGLYSSWVCFPMFCGRVCVGVSCVSCVCCVCGVVSRAEEDVLSALSCGGSWCGTSLSLD